MNSLREQSTIILHTGTTLFTQSKGACARVAQW